MRKLKTFWHTLIKSATEPSYYLDILRAKFSFSLRFFLLLLFFLSALDLVIFRLRDAPKLITDFGTESTHAVSALPNSFSVSYHSNGRLTTTGTKLPFSILATKTANQYGIENNLLTISGDESPATSSFFTLTPTQVMVAQNDNLGTSAQSFIYKDFLDAQNFSFTKVQLMGRLQDTLAVLPHLANGLTLIALPFWFIGLILATTLTLGVLTLLTNSFAWIVGVRMPLSKTFQLGLHAIGVATLLDVVKFAIYPQTDISLVIPGYLGIMILVFMSLRSMKKSV